jgi:hypothetical protein
MVFQGYGIRVTIQNPGLKALPPAKGNCVGKSILRIWSTQAWGSLSGHNGMYN